MFLQPERSCDEIVTKKEEKEKEVVKHAYEHSAGWGSLVSQPFLIREPQVPVRYPVSENKVDRS